MWRGKAGTPTAQSAVRMMSTTAVNLPNFFRWMRMALMMQSTQEMTPVMIAHMKSPPHLVLGGGGA